MGSKPTCPGDMLGIVRFHMEPTMMGYFKPLRRKLGVVALLVASVFASGWMRSRHYEDMMLIGVDGITSHQLVSDPKGICWQSVRELDRTIPVSIGFSDRVCISSQPYDHEYWISFPESDVGVITKQRWCGFEILRSRHESPSDPRSESSSWTIPYWSIVVPLTLLSAWLLLSRPRAKNTERAPKPSPN